MEPLALLSEDPGLPAVELPAGLRRVYGGDLGFAPRTLYANFVSSLDGVIALEDPSSAGSTISGSSAHDRFVMGLLRAFAAAVVVGAATFRAEPRHVWTAERIFPDAGADFADLRRRLGLPTHPLFVVVSARGVLPADAPALEDGALVLTGSAAAAAARRALPATVEVVGLGEDAPTGAEIMAAISERTSGPVLTEGGAHLIGTFVAAGLLDELFLTLSPVLAGRDQAHRRIGLLEGHLALPDAGRWGRLLSVRSAGSMLFLRYDLRG